MNCFQNAKRIVIKVGTSTLTYPSGHIHIRRMESLVKVLSDLKNSGREIVLVSSGAIGVGVGKLGMDKKPTELRLKQAAAAVGQCELMHLYDKFFGEYGQVTAQILLTYDNVDNKYSRQNLENTFGALLERGIIPIVNENDSVSTMEIETGENKVFGDNDTLSVIVAELCGADLLILLSDIDGLYDSDPRENPEAKLIPVVRDIDENTLNMAGGTGSAFGTGGMTTKLSAAHVAGKAGIDMVIMNGAEPHRIYELLRGEPVGTLFVAGKKKG